MGTVYLAEHIHLGRLTAVKVLRSELCKDIAAETRFRREAHLAAKIAHPAVAQIYDFERTPDGDFLIAMEYVEGETVAQRLRRAGALPIGHVAAALRGAADGLDAAHGIGILHRDLKPENLMLTPAGPAKLLDFGIARAMDATSSGLTEAGMVMGTPMYMSPEQLMGDALSPATDIYSLGAVVYEMLTAQAPHGGPSFVELRARRVCQPPTPVHTIRGDCPAAVSDVVARALETEPRSRWPSARQFVEALAEANEPSTIVVGTARRVAADVAPDPDRMGGYFEALRFAGREREVQLVRDVWVAARGGRATLLWIEGDEGAGKSCFFSLAQREAAGGGAIELVGRGYQADIVRPYGGWLSLLRAAHDEWGRGERRFPAIEALTDGRQAAAPARSAIHDEVGALIRAGAEKHPLFVGIEDLDWCDPASISLLEFLVHDAVDVPVLFTVTAVSNPAAGDPSLHALRERLRRLERVTAVTLRPLDQDAIAVWLGRAFGREPTDELVSYVCGHTDGNAFFIEQVVRSLLDRGVFERDAAETISLALSNDPPPEAIADVIRRRLRTLSEAAREVLQVAAIIGREFDVDTLLGLSARDEDDVLDALDQAVAAGVLSPVRRAAGDWYRFTHNEMARMLEQAVNSRRRRRLHGQIAKALEGQPQSPAAMQAWHWYHAGDTARAFEAARRATRRALAVHDYDDALVLSAIVLETAQSPAERREGHELRGDALRRLGRFGEAADAFALARSMNGADDAGADLRRKELRSLLRAGTMRPSTVASEALKLVAATQTVSAVQRAANELLLAEALTEAGDYADAREAARRAHTAAIEAGDQSQAADALLALGMATLKAGDPHTADQVAREASAVSAVVGDPHSAARSAMLQGSAAVVLGDVLGARAAFGEALRQAEGARVTRLAREIRDELAGLGA